MKWIKGRQDTGYYKMKIVESKWLKFDIYLLKFPKNSYVPYHTDDVYGYKHHRINIIRNAKSGGYFYLRKGIGMSSMSRNIINKFRPDIQTHAVTKVESGTRYVLSIGWLTNA
jgi:hypothetical protein